MKRYALLTGEVYIEWLAIVNVLTKLQTFLFSSFRYDVSYGVSTLRKCRTSIINSVPRGVGERVFNSAGVIIFNRRISMNLSAAEIGRKYKYLYFLYFFKYKV